MLKLIICTFRITLKNSGIHMGKTTASSSRRLASFKPAISVLLSFSALLIDDDDGDSLSRPDDVAVNCCCCCVCCSFD
uniref:Secreted protein n=1 Tax=Romanomermis culicivorax TaxID=13658 RepID=A0A915KM46_ROMCU